MYTIRYCFENGQVEDVEFAQHCTVDELRKVYNYETRTFKGNRSKVSLIEVYRFEELIFEYPTTNVNALIPQQVEEVRELIEGFIYRKGISIGDIYE